MFASRPLRCFSTLRGLAVLALLVTSSLVSLPRAEARRSATAVRKASPSQLSHAPRRQKAPRWLRRSRIVAKRLRANALPFAKGMFVDGPQHTWRTLREQLGSPRKAALALAAIAGTGLALWATGIEPGLVAAGLVAVQQPKVLRQYKELRRTKGRRAAARHLGAHLGWPLFEVALLEGLAHLPNGHAAADGLAGGRALETARVTRAAESGGEALEAARPLRFMGRLLRGFRRSVRTEKAAEGVLRGLHDAEIANETRHTFAGVGKSLRRSAGH